MKVNALYITQEITLIIATSEKYSMKFFIVHHIQYYFRQSGVFFWGGGVEKPSIL